MLKFSKGSQSLALVRSHSLSSVINDYHSVIENDDDDDDDDEDDDDVQESMFIEGGISEIPTDLPGISVSPRGSFIGSSTQVPSPSSAIISISQDMSGYLDPHRISYGSPAEFDIVPRISSPDDTFPVFSPPPEVNSNKRNPLNFSLTPITFYRKENLARLIKICLRRQTQIQE